MSKRMVRGVSNDWRTIENLKISDWIIIMMSERLNFETNLLRPNLAESLARILSQNVKLDSFCLALFV